ALMVMLPPLPPATGVALGGAGCDAPLAVRVLKLMAPPVNVMLPPLKTNPKPLLLIDAVLSIFSPTPVAPLVTLTLPPVLTIGPSMVIEPVGLTAPAVKVPDTTPPLEPKVTEPEGAALVMAITDPGAVPTADTELVVIAVGAMMVILPAGP